MRRFPLRLSSLVAPLALVGAIVAVGACEQNEHARASGEARSPGDAPRDDQGSTFATSDASAAESSKMMRGSPLCGVTAETCLPDDDGTKASYGMACATAPDLDASAAWTEERRADACRLTSESDHYAPTCSRAATGGGGERSGVDGVPCETSTDCAPGFDCVDADKGPTCRRYCCLGTCEDQTSMNGGATFCDVQKLIDPTPHLAPVCMPIKACKLLVEGECQGMETCAVVTEKGDTSCVVTGPARAGDACDELHCDAGLTCLGHPGNRRCYKLCKIDHVDSGRASSGCEPDQTCTTGSLFQDNDVGVCKGP